MENFFQTQLEKIIGGNPGLKKYPVTYVGRFCYLTLNGNRRAKIEINTCNVHERYENVSITILDANTGVIDRVNILFRDIFARQDNGAGFMLGVYIWNDNGYEWYCKPTEKEWVKLSNMVFEYVKVFN